MGNQGQTQMGTQMELVVLLVLRTAILVCAKDYFSVGLLNLGKV
jgi:hypothetical protein